MRSQNMDTVIKFKGQKITSRQLEILELIGGGYSNKEICNILFLTPKTVESHIANIRTIVSEPGERIGDRRLTLLAKEMVDGLNKFSSIKHNEEFETEETYVEIKRAA